MVARDQFLIVLRFEDVDMIVIRMCVGSLTPDKIFFINV